MENVEPPIDYSNIGPVAIVCFSLLSFLATVVVALRFAAKKVTRQGWGADDWLCLAALLWHHALMVASCVGVIQGGIGRDMRLTAAEDPYSVVIMFQAVFVGEIAYSFSSPLIKLSVLALYWRIFPTPTIKLGCKVLGAMCVAWCISITILTFVQCRPLQAFWFVELQQLPSTKCLDPILCFLSNAIANTVIDFLTLILPLHEVWKLHTTTKRKVKIGFVFLLGGIACAASLVRTVATAHIWNEGITNFTKQFTVSGAATVIEIYVAIFGACAPALMPFYRKLRYGDYNKSQAGASSKRTLPLGGSGSGSKSGAKSGQIFTESTGSFARLGDHDDDHHIGRVGRDPYNVSGLDDGPAPYRAHEEDGAYRLEPIVAARR